MQYKNLLILVLLILLINCRTMMLNQTGETLKNGKGETTFSNGLGFQQSYYGTFGPNFFLGLQQRFGLKDNIEFQFRFDTSIYTVIYYGLYPGIFNSTDFGSKLRFLNINGNQLSIIPFIGLYQTWTMYDGYGYSLMPSNYWHFPNYGSIGLSPITGFRFIGSYDFKKNNTVSFYYGLSFELKEELLRLLYIDNINDSINKGQQIFLPLLDFDIGLAIGWEIRKSIIIRHEICLNFFMDLDLSYIKGYYNEQEIYPKGYSVSLSYILSIGNNYSIKKN